MRRIIVNAHPLLARECWRRHRAYRPLRHLRACHPRADAYIHLIEPRVAGNAEVEQFDAGLGSRNFKPLITGDTKLISAGGHTLASGAAAVQSGEADAIAWGRQFIANPDLVERIAKNAPLNPYDRNTFYGDTEKGYTDYPFLDHEATMRNAKF